MGRTTLYRDLTPGLPDATAGQASGFFKLAPIRFTYLYEIGGAIVITDFLRIGWAWIFCQYDEPRRDLTDPLGLASPRH